ncbi:MAG: hypothetical protein KGZ97_12630 [Bacteroidetes bacterium]|nr:hypothetical protein [Bacteroidota bacterium]
MKKLCTLVLAVLFLSIFSQNIFAQDEQVVVPGIKLSGPRLGVTYVSPGELADNLDSRYGMHPFFTQFGWQFEYRYFTLENGTSGLVELVALLGGMDQGVIFPSASLMIGLRNAQGLEFGFGPNISPSGSALVFAVGVTAQSQNINFPINFAVVPSNKGIRFSLLVGFNARKK